ncbi:hypothetical protein [Dyella caseinilytica]|uniref:Glycosyl hydrolase family 18 (Putative chitinase) n=1 Tax=Dyella caseinilytica TaxID=1849581 RepID=A0ABX7GXZ7_9GAMM|nr:hypothetical protein [Dyella caseinilytica]QRN55326.1 hypothetical protein ISN74_08375 [Dyella caseinilytica]
MDQASSRHRNRTFSRLAAALLVSFVGITTASTASAQSTGYTGIFGGGPIYKNLNNNITELSNSGFTEVIVWSIEVSSTGNLNFNGEFPLVTNGAYVGNQTYPDFPSNLAALKSAGVKRITFSIGSSNYGDFEDISALVNSTGSGGGTGPNSILYKDFQALKKAIPSLDAIDLDDENGYDASTTEAFAVMLGNLGYHVMPDAYTSASYWTSLVTSINTALPGTVDGVHLQTYSGGSGNSPCSGWNFGSVPVYPGIADSSVSGGVSVSGAQSTVGGWEQQCSITGAFLWLYDDVAGQTYGSESLTAAYAGAINAGLSSTESSSKAKP